MATILRIKGLTKDWNGRRLFENVNMEINEGGRVALHGRNGCGKTTLLRILMGVEGATLGQVERVLPLEEWGWMKQQDEPATAGLTVLERVLLESTELWQTRAALKQLEQLLETADGAQAEQAAIEYSEWLERYAELQGYSWETQAELLLTRVGMPSETWQREYGRLSGGQKTRVRLAALMLRKPRVLVLDEPTNHMDEEGLIWLEEWLRDYQGTLLFVSHDRTFLNRVATEICELSASGVVRYTGGYDEYRSQKERERKEQETEYRKQEQAKAALEASIRTYREWFHRAHATANQQVEVKIMGSYYKAKANKHISRYHAKQKALERLEENRVEKPRQEMRLNMELQTSEYQAKHMLSLEQINLSFGDKQVINELNVQLLRGDRLAVLGPNGAGKTTLLRLITGELQPQSGRIRRNPQLRMGYFSQELENLPEDQTLLDSLLELPSMTVTEARTILGCFLFSRDKVNQQIGNLSMGEKCRMAFLRLYFSGANLLVLDEPTNYFDIDTREVIEEALSSYDGALVVVSHDRELIRRTATRLLLLRHGGEYERFDGSMDELEQTRQVRAGQPAGREEQEEQLRLELRLTELMQRDPVSAEDAQGTELLEEIRRIRTRLDELRRQE
ncbi:ribosomal protection-like ABC-F family protein [Paenibacillus sp. FSL K6-1230]|uniref:ribosomal protection-like ABC-F family protein n=1 Tax=Paenibacillus sp. FSL K6-1230 TaxID=2921603 RepID=UPI0003A5C055